MGVELAYIDTATAAPKSYVLPPSLAIGVESVSARFDGSGASESFLACLAVYSQDNKLIGRWFPSTIFAAGDSGEVSYGPF